MVTNVADPVNYDSEDLTYEGMYRLIALFNHYNEQISPHTVAFTSAPAMIIPLPRQGTDAQQSETGDEPMDEEPDPEV